MTKLVATIRRLLPHRLRSLVPLRARRFVRRWVEALAAGRQAVRASYRTARAEAAASDHRRLDEAAALEAIVRTPPLGSPRDFARLAKAYRLAGELERSLDAVSRGLERFPTDITIATEHAQLAMAAEAWDAAVVRWQALIDLTEDAPSVDYLTRLARAESGGQARDVDEALGPRAPSRAYAKLALAYQRKEDYLAAEEVLESGRSKHPHDARIARIFAENATQLRDWPAAEERWETVIRLKGDQPTSRSFVELARTHRMLGDMATADAVLRRGIEHLGARPTLLVGQAKLAMAERRWDDAVELWEKALRSRDTPRTHRGLARSYAGQQDFEAARRALDHGLASHPHDPDLSVEVIFLLISDGRWDDAQTEWKRQLRDGVELSPAHYAALARRASVNFHHDLADAFIGEAQRRFPGDVDVQRQAIRNAVTREKRQRPPQEWRWDVAFERAKQLAEASPPSESGTLHLALAHELAEAGALVEAREILRGCVSGDQDSASIRAELATLAMASGDWTEAARHLRAEQRSAGGLEGPDLIRLARAHEAAGEYDAARDVLRQPTDSDEARTRFETALIDAAAGRPDATIEVLEGLLQSPEISLPVDVYRQLALAYLRVGEEHAARRVVANARGQLGPSALEANPGVVAIIGGGPSLRGVDLEPLQGSVHSVAVNATAMALPWCDVAVTHDFTHLAERFHGFANPVVAGVSPEFLAERGKLKGFDLRRRIVTDRLSETDDVLHSGGHTSAHTALGYAYLLRPRRIVLFGVDLTDFWGPGDYWHDAADRYNTKGFEERKQRVGFDVWERYRREKLRDAPNAFASTLAQIERREIEVINASPASSVTCFPRVDPHEGIERCLQGRVID